MIRESSPWLLIVILVALGCSGESEPEAVAPVPAGIVDVTPAAAPSPEDLDPGDPSILRRPFTAEQIRDEWVQGFNLLIRARRPESEAVERWTVVEADADGLVLEYARLNRAGEVFGDPRVERSTWVELRDHATYPAGSATIEEQTRDTPLGRLDGWLYTQRSPGEGLVTEFFFARDLPGAPIHMISRRDGEMVMEILQLERSRPGTP